ncbi:putative NRPS-like enzyme [Earliella scabrosa]|nr:putative NRPS-like enzyme [Earliella scabrosa]
MLSVISPSSPDKPLQASYGPEIRTEVPSVLADVDIVTPAEPRTVDELMRSRSQTDPDLPLVSYPLHGINYVDYTPRQLDIFAWRTAITAYSPLIPRRSSSSQKPSVVGMLGPSNLDYLVTMLSLSKLGHTVMHMSTRISHEAHISLLRATESRYMVVAPQFADVAATLQRDNARDLTIIPMAGPDVYSRPPSDSDPVGTRLDQALDPLAEQDHVAWIIHSSGSTGLPKPIFLTHRAVLTNYSNNMNMRGFITLPLFHAHGISSLFRAIVSRKQIHLYNAALPLTKQYLMDIIRAHDFEIFYAVPYVLNLLAETQEGADLLSQFKIVMFGGSSCPDALGHRLTAAGVNLVSHYGSTETGQLMTSFRPASDDGWDYLRVSPAIKPFLRFEDRGEGLYECVCLDGWPPKVMSNRSDGAYATKDCFTKHPTLPDAWKYYCRLDDTLTLNNGEKANPLQLEGAARQCPLVDEAVMFGAGKARLGLALVCAKEYSERVSDDEVIDAVFKAIEPAHATLPAYAKVDRDMVLLLPADAQYRVTDKGTVVRQAFYKQFASQIDAMYEVKVEESEVIALSESQLRDFIRSEVVSIMNLAEPILLTDDQDFFGLGMDSLHTMRLRTAFVKKLDLGGHTLGLNCVFDYPSVASWASYLYALRVGEDASQVPKDDEMQALIEQYSANFPQHVPQPRQVEGDYVLITGATGSLGAHIAAQLGLLPQVHKVYCLVRAAYPTVAHARVTASLQARRLWSTLPASSQAKIIALPSDLSRPDLGLDAQVLDKLRTELSAVVHCAWAVNFNLQLRSFIADCVVGVRHLLDLCLSVRAERPAQFSFCSSVSTVFNTARYLSSGSKKLDAAVTITESLPPSLACAQSIGYAQSKLVAEHLCARAAASQQGMEGGGRFNARVLRIGQIVGDTTHGVWNTTEAWPLMLHTAVTLGALPALDEWVRWLPVDVVAKACVEIGVGFYAAADERDASDVAPAEVYNVINPHPIHWTRDLLPILREAGLRFEELPVRAWLERLRTAAATEDPVKNPSIKLLTFWEGKYGHIEEGKQDLKPEVLWETGRARRWSNAMATVDKPGKKLLARIVSYFVNEGWKGT